MKKVRNSLIVLLSALMLIGLIACNPETKVPVQNPTKAQIGEDVTKLYTTESKRNIEDPIVITSFYAKGTNKFLSIANISDKPVCLDGYSIVTYTNLPFIFNPSHPEPTVFGLSGCTNTYYHYRDGKLSYELKSITLNPGVTLFINQIEDVSTWTDLPNFQYLPVVDAKTNNVTVTTDSRLCLPLIADWNGNDPMIFKNGDKEISRLLIDEKTFDGKQLTTVEEVKKIYDEAPENKKPKQSDSKVKSVYGCAQGNKYYVRAFSTDFKEASGWDTYNLYSKNGENLSDAQKAEKAMVEKLTGYINAMFPAAPEKTEEQTETK